MKIAHRFSISAAAFLIGLGTAPVLAQTATATDNMSAANTNTINANGNVNSSDTLNSGAVDRLVDQDLNQQHRIQEGLKDGQLTTAEAARLERGEARIDQLESNALDNGTISAQQAAQIRQAENGMNGRITRLENNGVSGTASANADMIADVQRNINQQQRIDRGVDDGKLTPTEVSALEGGQATVDRDEFLDGRNNQITSREQQNIQSAENIQSTDIRDAAHNGDRDFDRNNRDRDVDQGNRDRDRDHFAHNEDRDRMTDNRDFRHDDHRFADKDADKDNGARRNDRNDRDHDRDNMNHDHFADNGQRDNDDHRRDDHRPANNNEMSDNMSGNMSGNVTASSAASPMATSANTNAAVMTSASANSPAVSTGSSAGFTAGSTASVTPASTPVTTAPHVAPHVAPPHIPVAHK
jgi:hypothetical protein